MKMAYIDHMEKIEVVGNDIIRGYFEGMMYEVHLNGPNFTEYNGVVESEDEACDLVRTVWGELEQHLIELNEKREEHEKMEILHIVNDFLHSQMRYDEAIECVDEFDEIMHGVSPLEIVQGVAVGFNVHHDYMQLDGYGRWVSMSEGEAEDAINDIISGDYLFIDYLIDNAHIDLYEFDEVDEYEDYNDNIHELLAPHVDDVSALRELLNIYEIVRCGNVYYLVRG